MYCRKCGNNLNITANFCNLCGTPVIKQNISSNQVKSIEYDEYIPDETINKNNNNLAITLVLITFMLSLGTIIIISSLTSNII